MDRRSFIEKTGLIGAAAILPLSSFPIFSTSKYKMGLQLYTIHYEMMENPFDSLKTVKSYGYKDFEIFGFNSENESFYNLRAFELKKILEDLQITVSSGHFGFSPYLNQSDDDLKSFVDSCINGAKALNMKYITWPWLAPEQRSLDHFKLLSSKLNSIGEQVSAAGLGFAYHNHGFEFIDHNGINGFDIILNETDPELVKLQMDMYWVMHSSKKTPKELIEEQPGRYVMWHLKDMDKLTRDYTELGSGSIDYPEILPDPANSGLEFYYLEQGGNFTTSAMKSVEDSAAYFKRNLQKFL